MSQTQSTPFEQLQTVSPKAARAAEALAKDLRTPGEDLIEMRRGRPVRKDLVQRIKEEIEAGEYNTEEKFDTAIERLMLDIEFESQLHAEA